MAALRGMALIIREYAYSRREKNWKMAFMEEHYDLLIKEHAIASLAQMA